MGPTSSLLHQDFLRYGSQHCRVLQGPPTPLKLEAPGSWGGKADTAEGLALEDRGIQGTSTGARVLAVCSGRRDVGGHRLGDSRKASKESGFRTRSRV